jgi:nucleotide-binding universal stress UspA family protein
VAEQKEVLQEAMHAEFHWLANALLNIARQRAERAGLSAEVIVREGVVKDEIEQFLRDNEASMLLLGAPRGTSPQFGDEAIERFAHAIEEDTGVPVTVVRPEDHESLLDRNRY